MKEIGAHLIVSSSSSDSSCVASSACVSVEAKETPSDMSAYRSIFRRELSLRAMFFDRLRAKGSSGLKKETGRVHTTSLMP